MLCLLLANLVEISVPDNIYMPDFLAHIARETNRIVLYDEHACYVDRQYYGPSFRHTVPRERVVDVYDAILAFFDMRIEPVPRTSRVCTLRNYTRGFVLHHLRVRRGRFRVVFAGFGTLELAHSAYAYARRPELMRIALLPKARRRLAHTLRGVGARHRAAAARLLRWFGPLDDGILTALREARKDEDAEVRRQATLAIRAQAQRKALAARLRARRRSDPTHGE